MSAADLCLALALSALLSVVVAAAQYMRAEKAEAEVARLTADHLPRRIEPGDFEVERVAATIHAAVTAAQAINIEAVYRSTGLNLSGGSHDFANIAWDAARAVVRDFDVWLIEDAPAPVDPDAVDRQCAWADYRKDYGVGESEMAAAHKAFMAGWKAAREGDQSGPLR